MKTPAPDPALVTELARCYMRAAVDDLLRPHWNFTIVRQQPGIRKRRRIVWLDFQREAS